MMARRPPRWVSAVGVGFPCRHGQSGCGRRPPAARHRESPLPCAPPGGGGLPAASIAAASRRRRCRAAAVASAAAAAAARAPASRWPAVFFVVFVLLWRRDRKVWLGVWVRLREGGGRRCVCPAVWAGTRCSGERGRGGRDGGGQGAVAARMPLHPPPPAPARSLPSPLPLSPTLGRWWWWRRCCRHRVAAAAEVGRMGAPPAPRCPGLAGWGGSLKAAAVGGWGKSAGVCTYIHCHSSRRAVYAQPPERLEPTIPAPPASVDASPLTPAPHHPPCRAAPSSPALSLTPHRRPAARSHPLSAIQGVFPPPVRHLARPSSPRPVSPTLTAHRTGWHWPR